MAKRSILDHKHKEIPREGFLCSTCEADGFSENFPTLEARQAHFDETGHGARNLMQQTEEKAAIRQVREAFGDTVEVSREEQERLAPQHRGPGTKLRGRQYGPDKVDRKGSAQDCSLKQAQFLVKLIVERKGMVEIEAIRNALADSWTERGERKFASGEKIVAKQVASAMIKKLLAIKPATTLDTPTTRNTPTPSPEASVPAQEDRKGPIRITNRYAGKCDQCGEKVEPGEGVWELADDGKRSVSHLTGQCPQALDIPNGRYAVEHEGTLKFYHATPHGLFVMASDEEHAIKSKDYIETIVELIKVDPLAAMQRYGHEIGKCGRCGRTLTDEDSRALGIGPICFSKMGM